MVWVDWGTVGQLLSKRDSWHLFATNAPGPITFHPLTNVGIDMSCEGRNFVGWVCDEEAERLRTAYLDAPGPATLEALHRRLAFAQPYRVLGQFDALLAHRSTVKGLLDSPVLVFWNIEK
jgi:peptide/nickel transport system substrate-binding protein